MVILHKILQFFTFCKFHAIQFALETFQSDTMGTFNDIFLSCFLLLYYIIYFHINILNPKSVALDMKSMALDHKSIVSDPKSVALDTESMELDL